ncbi:lisH domain-containing protein FOPNL-like isoform X2 [Trichoplusia ni]|uniref:LisH domain-containing protein FOPNL-like isoform X2 n=1 Tax=Trichoplusia ni TaxID=7111 RepID=A0A7E5WB19_TRINI|nr:lisH domain-containing protein FOPNL-like isoform X2 [Trichoplusia ni]
MNEKPISEKELLVAIKDLLKKNGYLSKINAEVRAQVTELLQDRQTAGAISTPPAPTEDVLLVNELVREYLEWNGYLYTASVMMSEAAMPKEKRSRPDLCAEVGVRDDEKSSALPLLSNIVAAYTERIKRKINKSKKDVC